MSGRASTTSHFPKRLKMTCWRKSSPAPVKLFCWIINQFQKRFVIGLCSFSPHIFKALRVIQKDYSDEPAASISQISVPHFARCPLLWICLSLFENIKASPCLDARAPHRSPLR